MKTTFKILTNLLALVAFVFLVACEGPAGPAGADGVNGADGIAGVDGVDGVDGNVTCMVCHSGTNMEMIQAQFASSAHNVGAIAVDYAGGRSYCAECHSHEGFVEWATFGNVAADITAPSAWKCSTCHGLHETMDSTDYAFRAGDDVTLMADGNIIMGENNNTCINCHQSRRAATDYYGTEDMTYTRKFTEAEDIATYTNAAVGPAGSITLDKSGFTDTLVVVFDVPVATHTYISSTHAGPHHGPQANVWAGVAGTMADGSGFGPHSGGCVTCHMGEGSGHSFMAVEANCIGCHDSNYDDKVDDMSAIADRISAVGAALEAIHAVHMDSDGAYHPVYASLTTAHFDAFFNFMIVLEDRSNGAHNPTRVDELLDNCEAALSL